MRKSILLLLLLLASLTQASAEYFRKLGLSDGLSQVSVMAIRQDRLGRMWFGTEEGINCYDGNQVRAFKGWSDKQDGDSAIWLGNSVSSIVEDRSGNLFFLIDRDIIQYELRTERFSRLLGGHSVSALASSEGEVWYVREDSLFCFHKGGAEASFVRKVGVRAAVNCLSLTEKQIYLGTADGMLRVDRNSGKETRLLEGKDIYRIFEDSQKGLWIGTRMQGLYRMKGEEVFSVPYTPHASSGVSSWQIRDFVEDEERNIWFGTFDGLQKYSYKTGEYSLLQVPLYLGGLAHPSVFSLYKDRQGIIWVGSYFGGVNYFIPEQENFIHYDFHLGTTKNLYYSYVSSVVADSKGGIWLGTDGGGVNYMDSNWNVIHQFTAGEGNALPHNNVKDLAYDEKNECLYIATHLGGLSRYDLRTKRFHNYLYTHAGADVPGNVIYSVLMWKGNLYVSARNGVFCLSPGTQRFTRLNLPPAYYEHFDIDRDGVLWLSRLNAVIRYPLNGKEGSTSIPLSRESNPVKVTAVRAGDDGVYIATLGNGLYFYDKAKGKPECYKEEKKQLASNYCYNVALSKEGNVLVTGDKGVMCYYPKSDHWVTMDLTANFPSAYIIRGCGICLTPDDKVLLGDTRGVSCFFMDEFLKVNDSHDFSSLYFSELHVNNRPVCPGDGTGILSEAFPYTSRLDLNHKQNSLSVSFAVSDYKQPLSQKQFRYKLEGLDDRWYDTRQTDIHYTSLPPGTYKLRVAPVVDNGQGEKVMGKEISMSWVIRFPWYDTWWAWMLYWGVAAACLYYFVSNWIARRTLALSLEKEHFEKQKIEQLNQEKLVFFTNVSHEFRTPLTLIISHVDILLQKTALPATVYNQILKINKHAQQMNNLISELLEFRKITQNYQQLRLVQKDLIPFLKEIYLSFADYALARNITYTFRLSDTPVLCWFDAQLLEKVFFNLLSNAFKYTADGKEITVSGKVTDQFVEICVSDTGQGISEKDVPRLFHRFFKVDGQKADSHFASGTGIGLALTKSIVEKHHGTIAVESTVDEGSTFTVRLPRTADVYREDENVRFLGEAVEEQVVSGSLAALPGMEEMSMKRAEMNPEGDKEHTVLLVEDNEELLQVLQELFAPFYKVVCATNGEEGLERVREGGVDLIVSDIMMPRMSGTEMCLQLKNNIDYCHIPVILLTALNTMEQNIEGLNRGADDYITKPFHAQLLLARANNLVRNRLLMQHQFEKKPMSEIDLAAVNPLDQDWLKRVSQVIEAHLDDVEFNVPVLCQEVGMSRSLLFAKFKALIGMTPNNFILNYRLKHAAALLLKYPDLSVAEVSDRCGFSVPVYFSRCFKNQYGCAPQTYRKEKGVRENTDSK